MEDEGKIRVGVLRGGPSSEYEVSLNSGSCVLKNLPARYVPIDVFIDRRGVWHYEGVPHEPHRVFPKVDVLFNALHGEYGEDGTVQELLDAFAVSYSGARRLAAAVAMNKALAKKILAQEGALTPAFRIVRRSDGAVLAERAAWLYRDFPPPSVVKPLARGSSLGVSIVRTEEELRSALAEAFCISEAALVEEFIEGREATCAVIEDFRGDELYAPPPIEIIPPHDAPFFDYGAKYSGRTREICPGNFGVSEKEEIQALAKKAHRLLDARHYSRSDFIVHPKRGIYFLELNTLPGLSNESLLPKALAAVGCPFPHFLEHVISIALSGRA